MTDSIMQATDDPPTDTDAALLVGNLALLQVTGADPTSDPAVVDITCQRRRTHAVNRSTALAAAVSRRAHEG